MTHFKSESLKPREDTFKKNSRKRWWFMLVWGGYIKERMKPS